MACDVPVVVLDELHLITQAVLRGTLPRVENLLARDIEGLDLDAIFPSHIECQRAPAAACFDYPLSGPQAKLAANVFHFGFLGLLEGGRGRLKVSAGVHQFGIEPQFVEIVPQIVVAMDVVARASQSIRLQPIHGMRAEPGIPALGCPATRPGVKNCLYSARQVADDFDAPLGIGFSEGDFGIKHQRRNCAAIENHNGSDGGDAWRAHLLAIFDHESNRRGPDSLEYLLQEPLLGLSESRPSVAISKSNAWVAHGLRRL